VNTKQFRYVVTETFLVDVPVDERDADGNPECNYSTIFTHISSDPDREDNKAADQALRQWIRDSIDRANRRRH
jgi:hypothetical protein